jgi:serine/threonine protein kinase
LSFHFFCVLEIHSPTNMPARQDGAETDVASQVGDWILADELGTGASGVVRRAHHARTGELAAVKVIKIEDLSARARDSLKLEIATLNALRGRNAFVQLKETIEMSGHIFLVFNLCTGGSLFDRASGGGLSDAQVARWVWQSALALQELANLGLHHLDIKLENLLLDGADDCLRLCDFGSVAGADGSVGPQRPSDLCCTAAYMAPELMIAAECEQEAEEGAEEEGEGAEEDEDDALYRTAWRSGAVDMWALGCCCFALLLGRFPFDAEDPDAAYSQATSPVYVARLMQSVASSEARDLLLRVFRPDPRTRITLSEFINHPWFAGARGAELDNNSADAAPRSPRTVSL